MKATGLALIVFLALPSLAHAEEEQEKLPSLARTERWRSGPEWESPQPTASCSRTTGK
jgi:hypothetical protein